MKRIDQTRTGYGRGNCTEAGIASLLGVALAEVPDIWAGPHVPNDAPAEEHQPMALRLRLWAWLQREHGVHLCGVKLLRARPTIREAWERACELFPLWVEREEWARYHLAIGPHPAGVEHQVVCEWGRMVHDSNPGRLGIVECHTIEWLVPLHLVPEAAREFPSAEWREQP